MGAVALPPWREEVNLVVRVRRGVDEVELELGPRSRDVVVKLRSVSLHLCGSIRCWKSFRGLEGYLVG
jgi:hypothetical protein